MNRRRISLTVTVSLLLPPATAVAQVTKRHPVPLGFEQKPAEEEIRRVYAREFRETSRSAMKLLAGTLRRRAPEEKERLPVYYVLLRESLDLALKAGDAPGAFAAIDAMAEVFEVTPLALKDYAASRLQRGQSPFPGLPAWWGGWGQRCSAAWGAR